MRKLPDQLYVVQDTSVDSILDQKIYRLRKRKLQRLLFPLELLCGKLRSNAIYLLLVFFFQVLEQVLEKAIQQLHHFVIMLLYSHFQIQPNKLRQVAVGVGVFCTENWTNLVHAFKVSRDGHLLGKLWRLREVGAALRWRSDLDITLHKWDHQPLK